MITQHQAVSNDNLRGVERVSAAKNMRYTKRHGIPKDMGDESSPRSFGIAESAAAACGIIRP
jgi:hypothetical protein